MGTGLLEINIGGSHLLMGRMLNPFFTCNLEYSKGSFSPFYAVGKLRSYSRVAFVSSPLLTGYVMC